jgi:hypothetical protein
MARGRLPVTTEKAHETRPEVPAARAAHPDPRASPCHIPVFLAFARGEPTDQRRKAGNQTVKTGVENTETGRD